MIDLKDDIINEHNASYLKYLTFIQDIISRMNRNAFQLKGWSITIVSALSALAVGNSNWLLFVVAALSTIPFCLLDAYYLLMERQFRGLYNDVIDGRADIKLFSMPLCKYTSKCMKNGVRNKKYSYVNVLRSHSILWFYGSLFLLCIVGCVIYTKCLCPVCGSSGICVPF